MGKKHRREKKNGNGQGHALPLPSREDGKRPRVLFAVGDAESAYTEGKLWRLVHRLREQTGYEVVGVTQEKEAAKEGERQGLQVWYLDIPSPGVSVEERLQATNQMIHETSELMIPGFDLPLWKILAMDDFVGSLLLYGAQPSVTLEADLIVVPIMCVDNNSRGSAGLYGWMVSQARQQGIPVVALEVSPLGNKNTFAHLPASHYAVKSDWARNFLIRKGIAAPEQVSVLRWEESYFLWSGHDEFTEAYLEKEPQMRALLKIPPDRFTVFIPHHVAFLWEVRHILRALSQVPGPMSVVIRTDPRTIRRQHPERDIVLKVYEKEIRALPHTIIDEQVGVGLLLQMADLVVSAFAGTVTERASLCRKPTIICQAMGEEGWQGESTYWEPRPEKIPGLIQEWRGKGLLHRTRLSGIVRLLLEGRAQAETGAVSGRPLNGEAASARQG